MKALLTALLISSTSMLTAHAEGEAASQPPVAKTPTETIEVAPEASTGLFERVREAHIRAIHKGTLSSPKSS